jgi:5-formyltetrahydrofolate cyclo-ligase
MSPDTHIAQAKKITLHLRELCLQQDWQNVAVYLANNEEVDIDNFIAWLLKRGTPVYAPRNEGFAPLDNLENVAPGNFGVREPQNAAVLVPQLVPQDTVFLVPGLAFDKHGGRLGFGGGWYDRALADFQHSLKIGIAFDCQMVDEVPCEAHDVKMDVIVTPSAVAEFKMKNSK